MRKLKEIVEQGKSTRTSPKPSKKIVTPAVPTKKPKPTLKFEFRWKHLNDEGEYKLKRANEGGGVRSKSIARDSNAEACLREARNLFFPNGKQLDEKSDDLEFKLGDFKDECISASEEFSAERYKEMYGFHTPRLVLLSSWKEKAIVVPESSDSSESDDEFLSHPPWHVPPDSNSSTNITSEPDPQEYDLGIRDNSNELMEEIPLDYDESFETRDESLQVVAASSTLIGSSHERRVLVQQIEREFETSLASDQAKDQQRKAEEQAFAQNERRQELRIARESQTPAEPDVKNPRVIIRVRHPELGSVSRAFSPFSKMADVYNWVGSLATLPEHFLLAQTFPNSFLYPDEDVSSVNSSVLYMVSQEDPVPMYSIQEDGNKREQASKAQVQLVQSEEDIETLCDFPKQFMEEDKILSLEEERASQLLQGLQTKCLNVRETFKDQKVMEVSRSNCLQELLAIYKHDEIMDSKVMLVFKDEAAVGDGVCREVYAVFWENFVTKYCEGKIIVRISCASGLTCLLVYFQNFN